MATPWRFLKTAALAVPLAFCGFEFAVSAPADTADLIASQIDPAELVTRGKRGTIGKGPSSLTEFSSGLRH